MSATKTIPRLLSLFLLVVPAFVHAQPASLAYTDCFSGNASQKLNISTIYAQVLDNASLGTYLNLTLFGESPQEILGFSNTSLATLFTTTSVLTLNAWTNSSYFCSSLRPPSPLPGLDTPTQTYCPLPAGPFGISTAIPWGDHRALTTLTTRLRAVDPFSNELICLEVDTTPLTPRPGSPYGDAIIIFWATVALAIAYWVVVGVARIVSAWGRGITRPGRGLWSRAQSAGFILASAISGERLATSPALMRFSTPSMRDIIFHTQWCAALAMVAVQWPNFVYPLFAQTAWSTLTYNVTLTNVAGAKIHHWDPLSVAPFNPPSNFADQVADQSSSLYINTTIPNILFTLPSNTTSGMASFAYTLGLRPQDLFTVSLVIFLSIIAGTIILSLLIWLIDCLASLLGGMIDGHSQHGPGSVTRVAGTRSPGFTSKDMLETPTAVAGLSPTNPEENKSLTGHSIFRPSSRFTLPLGAASSTARKSWWKVRPDINSFHGSVLHGNLVRILVLFHLPVTIFSCYQMTLPRSHASLSSIVLAALSFALFSIILPAFLVLRVTFTTTNKLYDETRTLLSLGPLYNHYRHGSQMFASLLFATNVAFGVTIGCGQHSGTAQAVIILVIEVVSALVTSVWLPWGQGASMGLISFLFCVARIVVAVLLVILTPAISIGVGAGGWVAYGILIILALVYLALFLMLLVKIVEAAVRAVGGIGFDRSNHVVDSGLLGACGLLGCCGPRKRRHRRPRQHRYQPAGSAQRDSAVPSELSSYSPPTALAGSRKGSTHSGPPPSVLRPEQALRPYREDSDDEGYIMGAWQPFPRGYTAVREPSSPLHQTRPSTAPGAASGFSRVGGGRAHIDSPYAITSGSTHTFPSIGHQSAAAAVFDDDESPPPSLSNVARHQEMGLPPGAMQPAHIRTKSQTAIIEDASALVLTVPSSSRVDSRPLAQSQGHAQGPSSDLLQPPVMLMSSPDDDDDSDLSTPKKKPWYHIRRHRAHSEGSYPGPQQQDEEAALDLPEPQAQPGRSFVVIRKPQISPARSNQVSSGSASPATNPATSTPGSVRGVRGVNVST